MKLPVCVATIAAASWAVAYRMGQTWGSTADERSRLLPGDSLVADRMFGGDHAITIHAAPGDIWPWLVQVGWHRGGWYTHRWVDRLLFPNNLASAEEVLPQFQDLKPGDVIPDGPPESGCFFTVEQMDPGHHLVLRSTTHLPPQLLDKRWVALNWTWTFALSPAGTGTRFHFRWRASLRPFWLRIVFQVLIMPADFLMGRSMCVGLKRRVEQRRRLG